MCAHTISLHADFSESDRVILALKTGTLQNYGSTSAQQGRPRVFFLCARVGLGERVNERERDRRERGLCMLKSERQSIEQPFLASCISMCTLLACLKIMLKEKCGVIGMCRLKVMKGGHGLIDPLRRLKCWFQMS